MITVGFSRGSKHFELIAFPEAVAELHNYAFSAFFANSRDGADGFYVACDYGATHFADRSPESAAMAIFGPTPLMVINWVNISRS